MNFDDQAGPKLQSGSSLSSHDLIVVCCYLVAASRTGSLSLSLSARLEGRTVQGTARVHAEGPLFVSAPFFRFQDLMFERADWMWRLLHLPSSGKAPDDPQQLVQGRCLEIPAQRERTVCLAFKVSAALLRPSKIRLPGLPTSFRNPRFAVSSAGLCQFHVRVEA